MFHSEDIVAGTAMIIGLGMAAQWIALRLRLPSILLLLATGLALGPGLRILDPNEMYGDTLFPIVSLSVALILYEGGLELHLRELRSIGPALLRLVSIGALVTWFLTTLAAIFVLNLENEIAILLGAILIVSGPTVILPLLLHIRPPRDVRALLKWEGIFIDPIGAILSVIVLQAILSGDLGDGTFRWRSLLDVCTTFLIGGLVGAAAALAATYVLKNYLIPDIYQNMFSLAVVIGIFALANEARAESGLFAVTIMGLMLANQPYVSVRRIVDFKENLRVLIISMLFIVLGARLGRPQIEEILTVNSLVFLLLLILVVRPIATLASTVGTSVNRNERIFIAAIAPRGIVAAAVASIFGLELAEAGIRDAEILVPYVFLVIIGTVLFYGVTAPIVARRLKLSSSGPGGVLILGAHSLAREMALSLFAEGIPVLLIDLNATNVEEARAVGLHAHYGNILSDEVLEELDLAGIDKFIAMTANDEVNSLASVRMGDVFDRRNVYQIAPENLRAATRVARLSPQHLRGRIFGGHEITYAYLTDRLRHGDSIRTLTSDRGASSDSAIPLFHMRSGQTLSVVTDDRNRLPGSDVWVIGVVTGSNNNEEPDQQSSRALSEDEMEHAGLVSSYCPWKAGGSRRHAAPNRLRLA